jgi:hypothetical protein
LFSSPEDEQSGSQEVSADKANNLDGFDEASASDTEESGDPEPTKSFVANIGDLRIFALDPVLGPHLPVAVLSIALVSITVSKFSQLETDTEILHGESAPEDFQAVVKGHADYLSGIDESWEPLWGISILGCTVGSVDQEHTDPTVLHLNDGALL